MPNKPAHPRAAEWPIVRAAWLAGHPTCAYCGSITSPEVHHIKPFHLFPELELNPANLVTLCEGVPKCHLEHGHLGNWSTYNANLKLDAQHRTVLGSPAAAVATASVLLPSGGGR